MVHFPNDTQHLLEIGRNGSGKTIAGLWHLSEANFDKKPWVIFDTKGDEVIEKVSKLDGVRVIKFNDTLAKSGLHIIRPRPDEKEQIESFLWRIHQRNNVGIYLDEGYAVGKSDALNALLTQGRSKHIPIIILSQRPSWLSRFCFSEASFFQVFALTDKRDRQTVQSFIPVEKVNLDTRLKPYHSVWYDVKRDEAFTFAPVPPSDDILATFAERIAPKITII